MKSPKEKCKHKNTKYGRDIELAYGSNRTKVCKDCGMWRQYTWLDTPVNKWRKTGYAVATQHYEED